MNKFVVDSPVMPDWYRKQHEEDVECINKLYPEKSDADKLFYLSVLWVSKNPNSSTTELREYLGCVPHLIDHIIYHWTHDKGLTTGGKWLNAAKTSLFGKERKLSLTELGKAKVAAMRVRSGHLDPKYLS